MHEPLYGGRVGLKVADTVRGAWALPSYERRAVGCPVPASTSPTPQRVGRRPDVRVGRPADGYGPVSSPRRTGPRTPRRATGPQGPRT